MLYDWEEDKMRPKGQKWMLLYNNMALSQFFLYILYIACNKKERERKRF
jgi:hypothetical protein